MKLTIDCKARYVPADVSIDTWELYTPEQKNQEGDWVSASIPWKSVEYITEEKAEKLTRIYLNSGESFVVNLQFREVVKAQEEYLRRFQFGLG